MTIATRTMPAFGIASLMSGFGPKPTLAPPDEQGNATAEETAAAAAAAEKAAAEKIASEKAASDKAAADKAEADRLEAEKNMSETDREKQKLLREVMEKKGKLKETEDALAAAKAEAEKFKGIDLTKVQELLNAEKTREEKELEAKGDFDRLKARIAEERAAEQKAWTEKEKAYEKQLSALASNIDNLTIGNDFGTSKFIQEDLILSPSKARALYGSHFEVKDGQRIAYDKPAGSANRTPLVDAAGEPVSFDVALRKIVEADPDRDSMLKSKVVPGASSKNNISGKTSDANNKQAERGLYGAARILAALNTDKNGK